MSFRISTPNDGTYPVSAPTLSTSVITLVGDTPTTNITYTAGVTNPIIGLTVGLFEYNGGLAVAPTGNESLIIGVNTSGLNVGGKTTISTGPVFVLSPEDGEIVEVGNYLASNTRGRCIVVPSELGSFAVASTAGVGNTDGSVRINAIKTGNPGGINVNELVKIDGNEIDRPLRVGTISNQNMILKR